MENMILLCIMILVGYATGCTFSPGDDIQHGYCTFNTGQYGGPYYAINTGCHIDCKCKINSTTGVSYIPTRGCLESYPCYKSDGTLRNFSQEYVMENTIGNCFVYNDNDNCALSCRCKKGYVDYKDSDGTNIKCGTCSDCQCDVNLDNLTVVGNLTARPNQGIPSGIPCPYQCPDFTGRINLNNASPLTFLVMLSEKNWNGGDLFKFPQIFHRFSTNSAINIPLTLGRVIPLFCGLTHHHWRKHWRKGGLGGSWTPLDNRL